MRREIVSNFIFRMIADRPLVQMIEKTGNLTLLSDGERRYGNMLSAICHEVIGTGKPGRPKNDFGKGFEFV
jgi:hypothetical protein